MTIEDMTATPETKALVRAHFALNSLLSLWIGQHGDDYSISHAAKSALAHNLTLLSELPVTLLFSDEVYDLAESMRENDEEKEQGFRKILVANGYIKE